MGFKLPKIGKIFSSTAGTKPHAMSVAKAQSPKPAQGNVSGSKSPFHVSAKIKNERKRKGLDPLTGKAIKKKLTSEEINKKTKNARTNASNKQKQLETLKKLTGQDPDNKNKNKSGGSKNKQKSDGKGDTLGTLKSFKIKKDLGKKITDVDVNKYKKKEEKSTNDTKEVKKDTRTAGQKRADRKKKKQDMKAAGASRKEIRLAKIKDKAADNRKQTTSKETAAKGRSSSGKSYTQEKRSKTLRLEKRAKRIQKRIDKSKAEKKAK